MREFLASILTATILCSWAWAADTTGVPPRASAKDYAVQGQADTATIAATIVPAKQVSKLFSDDIAKDYIVVEVAIYPGNGIPCDVADSDFALRVGQKVGRADLPTQVFPWQEHGDLPGRLPVQVTGETGVTYGRGNDPVYGPRQGPGPYPGTGPDPRTDVPAPPRDDFPASTYPNQPDPRMIPHPDPRIIFDKVQRLALPEGAIKTAIAGYLYFPQRSKKKKSDEIELRYDRDASEVRLLLEKPKP